MNPLYLSMFTQGTSDIEVCQYKILAGMQDVAKDFHHNKLYPNLGDLIELTSVLETIQANSEQYQSMLPRKLTGVDFEKKTLTFDAVPGDTQAVEKMFELVRWALPSLKILTEEGVAMFDFVTQNMHIEVVGIIPLYKDEGYAMIPDLKSDLYRIIRYELTLFTAESENYRALKTLEVESRAVGLVHEAPENVKMELVKKHSDLPNPATFLIETDLDFPFDETVFPVAKRKLMKHLIS
ncbi:MAG: hypothetical protein HQ472_10155 [Ignavibacteria bacterium]|nr:hypothetical protein [Ignavibacteria bacterium]